MNLLDMITPAQAQVKQEKPKKETKTKETKIEETKSKESKTESKFTYPFHIQAYTNNIDISGMFEEGKEYSEAEINGTLLEHGYPLFAGKVTWTFRKDENILLPAFEQHKKG